jgi:hypothetical protein
VVLAGEPVFAGKLVFVQSNSGRNEFTPVRAGDPDFNL